MEELHAIVVMGIYIYCTVFARIETKLLNTQTKYLQAIGNGLRCSIMTVGMFDLA